MAIARHASTLVIGDLQPLLAESPEAVAELLTAHGALVVAVTDSIDVDQLAARRTGHVYVLEGADVGPLDFLG
jgi:hypothetical protein